MKEITFREMLGGTNIKVQEFKDDRGLRGRFKVVLHEWRVSNVNWSSPRDLFISHLLHTIPTIKREYAIFATHLQKLYLFNQMRELSSPEGEKAVEKYITDQADKKYTKPYFRNKFIEENTVAYMTSLILKVDLAKFRMDLENCEVQVDTNFGRENFVSVKNFDNLTSPSGAGSLFDDFAKHPEFGKHIIGFRFFYDTNDEKYVSLSGHTNTIKFECILDKEGEEMLKNNKMQLATNIENFYKDCEYWGD